MFNILLHLDFLSLNFFEPLDGLVAFPVHLLLLPLLQLGLLDFHLLEDLQFDLVFLRLHRLPDDLVVCLQLQIFDQNEVLRLGLVLQEFFLALQVGQLVDLLKLFVVSQLSLDLLQEVVRDAPVYIHIQNAELRIEPQLLS